MPLQIDITPPNISATVGTVVPMSCEVSGVSPVGAFTNKPLPSSTLEYAFVMYVSKANDLYVGTGYTSGTDAKIYKTSDNATSWTLLFTDTTSNSDLAESICETLAGDIITTVSNTTGSNVRVYKNGLLSVTVTGVGTVGTNGFGLITFDNGNIVFGGGDTMSGSGKIYLSTNNATSFDLVHTGVVGAQGRMNSSVKIDGTSALMVDLNGYVYKTANSGANWAQVGRVSTVQTNYSIGLLGNRIIASRSNLSLWYQSTDGGVTWVSYVGTPPTTTPYNKITRYGNITVFGTISGRTVWVNNNDTGWVSHTLPDASITAVYDVALKDGFIFACTAGASGWGRVYRASAGIAVKTLVDTSDSSVLSTASPYNYTADIADDNKNFQWSVTDGVTTVQSALIPVNVYEELQIVSVNPESVDTTVGQTVVFSCTTSGGGGAVSLELIDTSDDTVLATTSPFSLLIENPISTYFKWVVTDGLSTVESALIPVLAVETNTIHETGGIIRGTIGNFKYTPIEKCYNDFSIEYGDGLKISISKVDQESFPPYTLGDWESYVSGVPSYADAKELWAIARNSYLLNGRVRTAPDERSKLAYSVDRNQFYSTTAYDTTEEYARQYVQLFTEWTTRQKLEVKYSLPMTADNAKLELMQVVYFSDVIITPEVGEYGKGWVTSIQCDTENDIVKVGLTFEPDFFLPPSLIVTGDIVETGYSTADIIETGTQTNNIIESGL